MPSAPDGEWGPDDTLRVRIRSHVVPGLDGPVKRACDQLGGIRTTPIDTIDLGRVRVDGGQRCSALSVVPDT